MGPSGSGKSTLLKLLLGELTADAGDIVHTCSARTGVDGVSQRFGVVEQEAKLVDFLSVAENLEVAADCAGVASPDLPTLMQRLGLEEDILQRFPHEMSGGECQRVALGRALLSESNIVIADEPTASLDRKTANSIATLIRELVDTGRRTWLVATHDPYIVEIADQVVDLASHQIAA